MTTNTPELRACPFCGSAAEFERIGDSKRSTIVTCSYCGASLETGEEFDHGRQWNHRAGETTWQPIESAPRDGSYVLTGKVGMRNPEIASFRYGCWDIFDREDIEYRPTHWMPLPLPPTGENK